jgi:hypothetical protein
MITIDHIGMPAHANQDAAHHLARVLGTGYDGLDRHRTLDGHLIEVMTPPATATPR